MRHGICRGSKLSGRPGLPAVDRDVHASNSTRPRPSQASDFVESGAGQLLLSGRKGDDRFRPNLAIESSDTGIGGNMSVIVVGHIVLLHPVVRKNSIQLPSDRNAGTYLFGFSSLGNPKNQFCEQKILL